MQSKPISTLRLVLYGCLTWVIPFLVAVPLMGQDGQPVLPMGVFKSLMVVVGAAVGAWLLVSVFRHRPTFRHAGFLIGLLWLVKNVGLDLGFLIPLTKMSLTEYFGDIALRYLVIPIMAIAFDAVRRISGGAS